MATPDRHHNLPGVWVMACSNQSPTAPEDTPVPAAMEEVYDPELAETLRISYPVPTRIDRIPPPENPTNGLLAARDITLFAQYDQLYNFELHAKGITLAMDGEDGEPTYLRRNATIRINSCSPRNTLI